MDRIRLRLPLALLAYPVWILITVAGANLFRSGKSLGDLVMSGPGWQFMAATLFLLALARLARWSDLGLVRPRPASLWLLLWLPALFILAFFILSGLIGTPPGAAIFWVGFNTLFVGFSEELMFRGVLFTALRTRLRMRPSIWICTLLFGAVHALNGLITGEFAPALLQSFTAFLSGLLFTAIVIRTGSLLPAILYHWLWDFGAFMLSGAQQDMPGAGEGPVSPWLYALPAALVLPNFLYALYLLRKVEDAPPEIGSDGSLSGLRGPQEASNRQAAPGRSDSVTASPG